MQILKMMETNLYSKALRDTLPPGLTTAQTTSVTNLVSTAITQACGAGEIAAVCDGATDTGFDLHDFKYNFVCMHFSGLSKARSRLHGQLR